MVTRRTAGPPPIAEPVIPAGLDGLDHLDLEADGIELDGLAIAGAVASGATVRDLSISRARLSGVQLTGSVLDGAELIDVVFEDCELSGVDLSRARLARVVFRRCRMSGLVATELVASDVQVIGAKADDAWLRMARLERCAFVDCDLTGSDWYEARLAATRLLRCRLDGAELSNATFDQVALHGSSVEGVRGAGSLRNLVIASDQVMPLALPVLGALSITIDDDYLLDGPPEA